MTRATNALIEAATRVAARFRHHDGWPHNICPDCVVVEALGAAIAAVEAESCESVPMTTAESYAVLEAELDASRRREAVLRDGLSRLRGMYSSNIADETLKAADAITATPAKEGAK